MSSALIRQALEFVDQEGLTRDKKSKRGAARLSGQDHRQLYKNKQRKQKKPQPEQQAVEENVKRLLQLSKPVVDSSITDKIVERAVKGRPLADFIEVSKEEEKSILFPDEPFEDFEQKLFCS